MSNKIKVKVEVNFRGEKREYLFYNERKLQAALKKFKRSQESFVKNELLKIGMKPYKGYAIPIGTRGDYRRTEDYNYITDFIKEPGTEVKIINLDVDTASK
jgi:hypothetical protein